MFTEKAKKQFSNLFGRIKKTDRNLILVFQKILNEAYLIFLLGCFLYFISEIILPGFLSARINFSTVYIALFLFSALIVGLGKITQGKTVSQTKINKKTAVILSSLATVFIAVILRPLPIYFILPLIVFIFFALYFLLTSILDQVF